MTEYYTAGGARIIVRSYYHGIAPRSDMILNGDPIPQLNSNNEAQILDEDPISAPPNRILYPSSEVRAHRIRIWAMEN